MINNTNQDHIQYHVETENEKLKVICLSTTKVKGKITIWYNNIVEEEILRIKDEKLVFYLHFTITDLAQGYHLFINFIKPSFSIPNKKNGKLRSVVLVVYQLLYSLKKCNKSVKLENLHFQLVSLSLDQLYQNYQNYDALYLAPTNCTYGT